jgi:phosphoribosylglycinamide formyltransferase-1
VALPIAVLVSGSGSNLQAVIDRIEEGVLDAEIRLVLSNKPDAHGLERARRHNLPTLVLSHRELPSRDAFDRAMVAAIRETGADTVVLAGFMRLLGPEFVRSFRHILNVHPALLPSFPGLHAQRQAAAYCPRLAGATVHFVDDQVDHGPIVIQAALAVRPGEDCDALSRRILKLEHRIYPQAIGWLAQGRLRVDGRQVFLDGAGREAPQPVGCLVNPPLEEGF